MSGVILELISTGIIKGFIWFPVVLVAGLYLKFQKSIDVSIDGVITLVMISYLAAYNYSSSFIFALTISMITSLLLYTIRTALIQYLKIEDVLCGVLLTLVLQSLSVNLIGESLTYENDIDFDFKNTLVVSISFLVILTSIIFSSTFFKEISSKVGNKLFNSFISFTQSRFLFGWLAALITSIASLNFTSFKESVVSYSGFDFLVTGLSSFLVADVLLTSLCKLSFSKKIQNVIIHVIFVSLFGAIFFQVLSRFVIYFTDSPTLWKLILGVAIFLFIGDFKDILKIGERGDQIQPIGNALALSGVSIKFDSEYILDSIQGKFEVGINIIRGENGVGKSTLMKSIACLLIPDNGSIIYNDRAISEKDCFYLSQNPLDNFNVGQSIMYQIEATLNRGKVFRRQEYKKRPLSSYLDKYPNEISGGQKQSILMEFCKLYDAPIIIADEPTSGLDESNLELFKQFLALQLNKGKIIIIATHDNRLFDQEQYTYFKLERNELRKCKN